MWVHVPAAIATAAVFALGADCPLTVWQKSFLRRAGTDAYDGGFIEYYVVEPITGDGMTPAVNAIVVAAWFSQLSARTRFASDALPTVEFRTDHRRLAQSCRSAGCW